jgi:hypothetical protein
LHHYDAAMSGLPPTVVGALIAGGAALVGFGASTWNTRLQLRSNRRQVRDQLLWEKKTELYEATIEATGPDTPFYPPLTAQDVDTLQARRSRLGGLELGTRLYASAGVTQRFYDYQQALTQLSACADKFQTQFAEEEYRSRLRLVGALRFDVQGMENPLVRERIHHLYERWIRVRSGWQGRNGRATNADLLD